MGSNESPFFALSFGVWFVRICAELMALQGAELGNIL
jgi:hypothetical protein